MRNEEWRMKNGEWRMENGEWRMENGEWRMENGELIIHLIFFNSYFLLFTFDLGLRLWNYLSDNTLSLQFLGLFFRLSFRCKNI